MVAVALLLVSSGVAAQARIASERIYIEDSSPSWSPDGKRIVFERIRERINPRNGECCLVIGSRLYVMDADGRNLCRIPGGRLDFEPRGHRTGS